MNYTIFETELSYIKNDEIKNATIDILKNANSKFYSMPASSSGKYHSALDNMAHGLVNHVKSTVMLGIELLSLEYYNKFDNFTKDCIISALLLHDICKYNDESDYTDFAHPNKAAILVEDKGFEGCDIIANLIRCHMGQWTTSKYSDVVLKKPISELEQFVHMCDYISSRSYVDFDIPKMEETLKK